MNQARQYMSGLRWGWLPSDEWLWIMVTHDERHEYRLFAAPGRFCPFPARC
jgi:hypothetical protein